MKRSIIILLVTLAGFALNAQESGFGAGIIVGQPVGVSLKLWLNAENAIDAALAWSFSEEETSFHFHGDYLIHLYGIFPAPLEKLFPYAGVGAKCSLAANQMTLGARVPVGLVYMIQEAKIDIFLEFVPAMDLFPATAFTPNGGLGVRYYF